MNKRLVYGVLTVLLALNLIFGAQIYLANAETTGKDDPYENYILFTKVLETIRQHYVSKVSYQQLFNGALRGMVSTLDPHSEFMEPVKFKALRDDTEGVFGGVGLILTVRTNKLKGGSILSVSEPMEETPAARAGIRGGDQIVKIGDKSTDKFTLDDAVKILRGVPGTEVTLTIFRPETELDDSAGKQFEVKLTRAEIKVDTIKDINGKREFPLLEGGVGYLRMRQFGEQTSSELEDALKKLEAKGMQSLVMDLRDNPGGLLDQAVKVCEKFLQNGQPVVSTEARDPAESARYTAHSRTQHPLTPMVILVNGGSASASEIVSGCLQDLKRAIIVGEQTFGKGSVQSILPMERGYALRLTTARYFTPSHKVIHEKGITPDIIVPMSLEDEQLLAIKRNPSTMENLDEKAKKAVRGAHDAQLDRATDLLKGITLFTNQAKEDGKVAAQTLKN